mgnify:CR=1 FL=1
MEELELENEAHEPLTYFNFENKMSKVMINNFIDHLINKLTQEKLINDEEKKKLSNEFKKYISEN